MPIDCAVSEMTMRARDSKVSDARIVERDTSGVAPASEKYNDPRLRETATIAEQRAYEDRVVRESERREYRAALSAAGAQLSGETFIDDRGQEFTVGASVIAKETIPYHANDRSGVKWMACSTRGEIVTFAGTREYPTTAIQFDGRPSLHLFNARELRAVVRVVPSAKAE